MNSNFMLRNYPKSYSRINHFKAEGLVESEKWSSIISNNETTASVNYFVNKLYHIILDSTATYKIHKLKNLFLQP